MKIPFVGPSYQARSLNVDAQRSVNCYLEMDSASPRAPIALYGTPGTTLKFTLPQGPVRGVIGDFNRLWFVAGNSVYQVLANYAVTLWGTIGTNSGPVGLAFSGTQVLIVDGTGGWIITSAGVIPITDPDFPTGVRVCAHQDGYFIVAGNGSGRFYISNLADGFGWVGTEFASAEGSPDNTIGIISDHRELWMFGDNSAEVWVNTGNADFPFERSGNAYIEVGVAAGATIAKMDNTIFWLGQDDRGFGMVWKARGYSPERISTHAVEKAIQSYSTVSDAQAYCYQIGGHSFYVLTFPTANHTWVYDVATEQWHEWLYRDPNLNTLGRHRSNCHVFFNNTHLVGDFENGNVYALDLDTYTDNGAPILRLRATQCLDSQDGERLFYKDMQVDMETGVGLATGQGSAPLLMMRYSNDGGHTWSNLRTVSIGAIGKYALRAIFRRLGVGRNRGWEISMTDPVKFAVMGAFSRFTKGAS